MRKSTRRSKSTNSLSCLQMALNTEDCSKSLHKDIVRFLIFVIGLTIWNACTQLIASFKKSKAVMDDSSFIKTKFLEKISLGGKLRLRIKVLTINWCAKFVIDRGEHDLSVMFHSHFPL